MRLIIAAEIVDPQGPSQPEKRLPSPRGSYPCLSGRHCRQSWKIIGKAREGRVPAYRCVRLAYPVPLWYLRVLRSAAVDGVIGRTAIFRRAFLCGLEDKSVAGLVVGFLSSQKRDLSGT